MGPGEHRTLAEVVAGRQLGDDNAVAPHLDLTSEHRDELVAFAVFVEEHVSGRDVEPYRSACERATAPPRHVAEQRYRGQVVATAERHSASSITERGSLEFARIRAG